MQPILKAPTSPVFEPLLCSAPLKGAKGGRSSGKSHFFAEELVLEHIEEPDLASVCIREVQKSLKFSAKRLIESKIKKFNVSHMFEITQTEIRRRGHDGIILFQGMQDHTADSIKSLEGFNRAWCEEAQNLSHRSLELLLPTIRADGSEIWFSWNPDQPDDPVEQYIDEMVCVHANYTDNVFCPKKVYEDAARHLRVTPDTFGHVWLGDYNQLSDAQVFRGKWEVREFEPAESWQPLFGLDWGFSQDPTAAVQVYRENNKIYIYKEAGKTGLELDSTASYLKDRMPEIASYTCNADSARPESISYCKRKGLPLLKACEKWSGSVIDGIEFIKSHEKVVIHPSCKEVATEFRLYSYQVHKQTGEITRKIIDAHNHYIDAIRYALGKLIRHKSTPRVRSL